MKWQILAAALILVQPLMGKEPQLSCEKRIGEMNWQGMIFHRYRLKAENFPPRQTFRLIVKSFDGTTTETFKYFANSKGHLILQPPEDVEGEIYAICPAKRGERLTFLMQADEGEDSYEAEVIPFPLEMRSKKGIRLSLELQGEKGEKFLLFAQGFNPCEDVELFLEAQGKKLKQEAQVTSLGDLCAWIQLSTESEGGEAKLVLVRKNEEVVFPFQWGAPALKFVGACCFEIK
ncbi:MAG: hypothetical protein JSS60_06195 [Verrucomicrobia bacterium]|nr:hypothetical protein [Verrucomicrobiota bacterium]